MVFYDANQQFCPEDWKTKWNVRLHALHGHGGEHDVDFSNDTANYYHKVDIFEPIMKTLLLVIVWPMKSYIDSAN